MEEKAIRMLHGLTEEPEALLQFALGANEEAQMKLALMEENLLNAFAKATPPELKLDEAHLEAKSKIISALRGES